MTFLYSCNILPKWSNIWIYWMCRHSIKDFDRFLFSKSANHTKHDVIVIVIVNANFFKQMIGTTLIRYETSKAKTKTTFTNQKPLETEVMANQWVVLGIHPQTPKNYSYLEVDQWEETDNGLRNFYLSSHWFTSGCEYFLNV